MAGSNGLGEVWSEKETNAFLQTSVMGMGELKPHHKEIRMDQDKKRKTESGSGEPDDRGGQLQTVVWFWGTEASPILSFLIHAVRWGATIPEGRQEPSAIWKERKIQKKAEKKRRAQGLDRFGTSRKEKRITVLIFQWKNVFIWSLSHSEERNSPGNYPNPSVETISYRVLEPSAHTRTHTHSQDTLTHTRLNIWT